MKFIVCGGRDYKDEAMVFTILGGLHLIDPIDEIIEGGALGADRFARNWAQKNNIKYTTVEADWTKNGRAAGPIRNRQMVDMKPDGVIAFPGGRGTANMIKIALNNNIKVAEMK